ncbi:unnamed protein product [Cylindrotheca closterium]|uniref:Uncharacterized protein n=1 Tax=Cylindrotheca closterium TaxID=2856 RepID=A0AAD2FFD6_9STRA|nr:unnamed protein product [Cylindrotheca closterium]
MAEDRDKILGQLLSSPLPVYSPDNKVDDDDSYETDSENDSYPSSLPHLGYASQLAMASSRRPRRSSTDSAVSLDYEYETDSDASASPPPRQSQESSISPSEVESKKIRHHEPDADDAGKSPSSSAGHHHQRPRFDTNVSLGTVEYETDSDSSQEPHHKDHYPNIEPLSESNKRPPQDPDASNDRKPPPTSESTFLERANEELILSNARVEKWKESSERLEIELKEKVVEVQNQDRAQEDLWHRVRQLESDKAESENIIVELGSKVTEVQQLLVEEQAAHKQTKNEANDLHHQMENQSNDSATSRSSRKKDEDILALQELVKAKDIIIQNALADNPHSESEKVAELEKEIQEAQEIIKSMDQVNPLGQEALQSIIQEKDAEIASLQSKNQELVLSQNALKHKNESMDALLTRKEALLKSKDQEIASLKEVIRKKDVSLRAQAASPEEKKAAQPSVNTESKPETALEDTRKITPTTAPSEHESASVEKEPKNVNQDSPQVPADKSLDVPQSAIERSFSTKSSSEGDRQKQLEYDLDEELDSLRTKVHDMMNETGLLTDVVDQKDAALQQARRQLEKCQAENARLKSTASSVDAAPSAPMEELQSLQTKLQDAEESIAAQKFFIASLQAELLANESNESSSSVVISDMDDSEQEQGYPSGDSSGLEGAAATAKSKSNTKAESDDDSLVEKVQTRVFGQEQKLDAEMEQERALESQTESSPSSMSKMAMMEVAEELSELKHSIRKREESIEGLRAKLQEHEALISLLNKTLSGKDTKIDRLERLIGQSHRNVNISKELEENDLTIDALVLYRFEKEHQMKEMQDKIKDLEDKVRGSKEMEYQLRRRTEELSGAEGKIRRLKAELKSESQRMTQLLEEKQEKLGHANEEKIRLHYAAENQSHKLNEKLREKDELIKSIHSDSTEQGLMIDSLEASLQETNKQLQNIESKAIQQACEVTLLSGKLSQLNREKAKWIEAQQDKDELIQMLNESRSEGQRIIAELTKQKPETTRQKALRRYHKLQMAESGVSGLEAYMEPFVLDIHQAQAQYEKARKNLRLAEARERLIRPRE